MLDIDIDAPPVPLPIDSLDQDNNELPTGRPRRTLKVPQHLRDFIPTDTGPIRMGQYSQLNLSSRPMRERTPTPEPSLSSPTPSPIPPCPHSPVIRLTEPNDFGVYREYTEWPTHIPKGVHAAAADSAKEHRPPHSVFGPGQCSDLWSPFTNPTIFRLFRWYYSSEKKTLEDLDRLVHDVILQGDFSVSHCEDVSAAREARHLDKPDIFHSDLWKEDSVEIPLPQKGFSWSSEADAPVIKIDGVWHRLLTEVLTSAFQDSSASDFHLKGYKEMWKPSEDSPAERIYAEVYTSPAYLDMEEKICAAQAAIDAQMASVDEADTTEQDAPSSPCQVSSRSSQMSVDSHSVSSSSLSSHQSSDSSLEDDPVDGPSDPSSLLTASPKPPPGVAIENVVVPMMLYTNSTHLTNFGDASLWPGYIFYGFLSKYIGAIPDAHAAHHFVYMPEVSRYLL